MFRNFGAAEMLLLLVVVLLLFGAKRLPDMSRSLGRSMRIFKSEVKEMRNEDAAASTSPEAEPRGLESRQVVDPEPQTPRVTAEHSEHDR